jgi:hypothetical protein
MVKMGGITNRSYTLEGPVRFLAEQRTEPYEQYCSGVAEAKNVLGAENSLQSWALLSLGRNGV